MSYLDRFDRHYKECCEILSVEEQVRSGFRTKGDVAKAAKILYREFGKKTKAKRTRNKKTGEEECCCCSVEAIAKNLVPPSIKEMRQDNKSLPARAFKPRSRGGLVRPVPITNADAQNQTFVATTDAGNNAVAVMISEGTLAPVGMNGVGNTAVVATTEEGTNAIAEMVSQGTMAGVGFTLEPQPQLVDTGVQFSDAGGSVITAPPLSYNASLSTTLFSDATPYSGLGEEPNFTLSTYGSYDREFGIESVSDDRSEDSLTFERNLIQEGMNEDELMRLYDNGTIDLNQLAEGINQLRSGVPPQEVLQLGENMESRAESRARGGRREGSGRPTRGQVRTAIDEGMQPRDVRGVDQTIDRMLEDLEEEEDLDID